MPGRYGCKDFPLFLKTPGRASVLSSEPASTARRVAGKRRHRRDMTLQAPAPGWRLRFSPIARPDVYVHNPRLAANRQHPFVPRFLPWPEFAK